MNRKTIWVPYPEMSDEGPPPGWGDHDQPCSDLCPRDFETCLISPADCAKIKKFEDDMEDEFEDA